MADLIERQAAIDKLKSIVTDSEYTSITDEAKERVARKFFADIPSAQPERKKGKWIVRIRDNRACFICSECNDEVDICGYGFCPNCGADMRGEEK